VHILRRIDDVDRDILRRLQKDASASYESISKIVGTSVGTVYNRIKKMKEEGVIVRILPDLDVKKLGFDICAIIEVRVEGGHIEDVQNELSNHPNVCSIYDVTGDFDTIFVTKFHNTEELNDFVKKLGSHDHVMRTNTKLALNVVKEETSPRL